MSKKVLFFCFPLALLSAFCRAQTQPDWNSLMLGPGADFYSIRDSVFGYFEDHEANEDSLEGEDDSFQNFLRWEYFWRTRVDDATGEQRGEFTTSQRAMYQYLQNASVYRNSGLANATADWAGLGPKSYALQHLGRVECLSFDPNDHNTLYIGTRASGIWKTTNAQAASPTWVALQDGSGLPGLGVQSIIVDKNNSQNIYIATGGLRDYGVGVLRSTDGGQTWNTTGLTFSPSSYTSVFKLLMDPTNSDILWAMKAKEVLRTTDGGSSWTSMLQYTPTSDQWGNQSRLIDMEFDPNDPSVVFVCSNGFSGLSSVGSPNQGGSLFKISSSGPSDITPVNVLSGQTYSHHGTKEFSWLSIATTPADPNTLSVIFGYAYYNASVYNAYVQKFDVVNDTWIGVPTQVTAPAAPLGHIVSPTEPNKMYTSGGGLDLLKSTDGGQTWVANSGTIFHGDFRFAYFEAGGTPGQNGVGEKLWVCTDGGVGSRTDGFIDKDKNGTNLDITEFYGLGTADKDPSIIVGGAQDNGIFDYNYDYANAWHWYGQYDGGECAIDYNVPTHLYGELNYLFAQRLKPSGLWYTKAIPNSGPNYGWRLDMPLKIDPVDPDVVYIASRDIYKASTTITNINQTPQVSWSSLIFPNFNGGWIGSIALSASNPNVMYAGLQGPDWQNIPPTSGYLFYTDNLQAGAPNWTAPGHDLTNNITTSLGGKNPFQTNPLTDLIVHPYDPKTVWLTFGGFGQYKVIKSTDGGLTWTDASSGLPDFPVNTIAYEKGTDDALYAGTDVGVFYKNNSMTQWVPFNDGLPVCIVTDLKINYGANVIRAATFGRSVWESSLACPSASTVNETGVYSASDFVEAKNTITSDAVVQNNLSVTYRAGDQINLKPGFSASGGTGSATFFNAFIHGCDHAGNSFQRHTNSSSGSSEENSIADIPANSDVKVNRRPAIKIQPNPNPGSFLLIVESNYDANNILEVTDLTGRVVFRKERMQLSEQIVPDLENGIYLLKYVQGINAESQSVIISR